MITRIHFVALLAVIHGLVLVADPARRGGLATDHPRQQRPASWSKLPVDRSGSRIDRRREATP